MNDKDQSIETKNFDHGDGNYNRSKRVRTSTIIKLNETEEFIITIGYDTFVKYMLDSLAEHSDLSDDMQFLKLIMKECKTSSLMDAEALSKQLTGYYSLNYCIADLLEKGKCYVYNKSKECFVSDVEVQKYGMQIGPMAGSGGRNFLADKKVFFSVMDWIS